MKQSAYSENSLLYTSTVTVEKTVLCYVRFVNITLSKNKISINQTMIKENMGCKDNCRIDGILCFRVEGCKILQFNLDAVQMRSLDKEQNVDIIMFLLFKQNKRHTSLVK